MKDIKVSHFLIAFTLYNVVVGGGKKHCGSEEPDHKKTCISIRLPWLENPIYFCEEKSKVKYQKTPCGSSYQYCQNWQNNSLLVQTPWDCCPLVSNPDRCGEFQCPSAPFNRTCHTVETEPEEKNSYDLNLECCPRYFCEKKMDPKDCSFKKLHSSCSTNPPKGKKNCIAFRDQFGCCPKFQCDGDRKQGLCPMEKVALKYHDNSTATESTKNDSGKHSKKKVTSPAPKKGSHTSNGLMAAPPGAASEAMVVQYDGVYPYNNDPLVSCVGDYNCPGKMLCCANNVNAYSDGKFIQKNTQVQDGYCSEPAKMD